MINSIIVTAPAPIEKSIVISVPVNMRKLFPTDTVRNFSSDTCVVFNPDGMTRFIERIDVSGGDARVYGMDTFISTTGKIH